MKATRGALMAAMGCLLLPICRSSPLASRLMQPSRPALVRAARHADSQRFAPGTGRGTGT